MKRILFISCLLAFVGALAGCSSDDKLSAAEEQKMKDGFAQKRFDPSKLTASQKEGMQKFYNGAPPGAPAPGPAASAGK